MAQFAWVCAWLAIIPAVTAVWNLLLYRPPPMRGVQSGGFRPDPRPQRGGQDRAAVNAVLANRDVGSESRRARRPFDRRHGGYRARHRRPPRPGGARLRRFRRDGRASSMPAGIWPHLARHPLLVFVDADVRLSPDALGRMAAFMAERPDGRARQRLPAPGDRDFPRTARHPDDPFPAARLSADLGHEAVHRPRLRRRLRPAVHRPRRCLCQVGRAREISASLHDGVKLPRIFRRAGFFTDLFDATEIATCRMYRGGARSGRASRRTRPRAWRHP